jgi:hypothetical protein
MKETNKMLPYVNQQQMIKWVQILILKEIIHEFLIHWFNDCGRSVMFVTCVNEIWNSTIYMFKGCKYKKHENNLYGILLCFCCSINNILVSAVFHIVFISLATMTKNKYQALLSVPSDGIFYVQTGWSLVDQSLRLHHLSPFL